MSNNCHPQPTKVLITTIGKVGSSSIYQYFIELGFTPYSEEPQDILRFLENPSRSVIHTHNLSLSGYIAGELKKQPSQKTAIFVGSRDLLRRHISAMFENINNPRNKYWHHLGFDQLSFQEQAKHFEGCLTHHWKMHARNWLHKFLVIHQMPTELDQESRTELHQRFYCIREPVAWPHARIIFYRMESLCTTWPRVLQDLSWPESERRPLRSHNLASEKKYHHLYQNFLKEYKPSAHSLAIAYDCDLKAFYTDHEIEQQQNCWSPATS